MASNTKSRFSPFRLAFEHDIAVTGIKYVPDKLPDHTPSAPNHRPLVICIHGATCSAHNFDIGPGIQTISTPAEMLSAPVISINRPGYVDSTPLPIPEGSTYHKTLGNFYHDQLFPALWREFGEPNQCRGLVILAHSLGAPGVIVCSALHAQDPQQRYPLAGFIFSGWGFRHAKNIPPGPTNASEKLAWKRLIMLADPEHDCAPPSACGALELQDQPGQPVERDEIVSGIWNGYWREYSDRIKMPIMWGIGEHDRFFEGSRAHIREYEAMFPSCPRFDGSLVLGAPHAIEWSHVALGWYLRCFGFALEVCALLDKK